MAYYERNGPGRFAEIAIPIILVALVLLVIGAEFFGFCPPIINELLCKSSSVNVLILTNENDKPAADRLSDQINGLTRTTGSMVHSNIRHIKTNVLTSQDYRLVILFGDDTALTNEARTEITKYVEQGGSLLIVKGAGLQQLKEDKQTISPWVFGWGVGDMERIIKFRPDCDLDGCKGVEDVTVPSNQMGAPVSLVPIDFDHAVIRRIGLQAPQDMNIDEYPEFDGAIRVNEYETMPVADLDWFDNERNERDTPAIITYNVGTAGTGGRVTYISYNPMQLGQESLFRNIVEYAMEKVD